MAARRLPRLPARPGLIPFAERTIGNPDIAGVAAYAVTFLGLLIVLSLLANLVGRVVRLSALGGLDRTLGLVFGIVRGAVVLIAAYILGGQVMRDPSAWPPQIKQARALPLLYHGALWAAAQFPPAFRPAIAVPPDDHPLTSEALLHATPDGAAIGPRPHQP